MCVRFLTAPAINLGRRYLVLAIGSLICARACTWLRIVAPALAIPGVVVAQWCHG